MKTVEVHLGERSYPILVGVPLTKVGEAMAEVGLSGKCLLVTDATVKRLYGKMAAESLQRARFHTDIVVFPEGEEQKNLDNVNFLYQRCMAHGMERQHTVVALGGGVVGDLAGFAAATFKRGVNLVMIPTTVVAQVDSSVGGKVAVNHPESKNAIGSFYQPKLVYVDLSCLRTLPDRQFRSGFAEVIKYGVIADKRFFAHLERDLDRIYGQDPDRIEYIVWRSCQIKRWIVERDEVESKGVREWLNFGHTVGHALETVTGYGKHTHGEAVAIGMVCAAILASRVEMLSETWARRIERLIYRAGLPTRIIPELPLDKVLEAMGTDKKVRDGKLRFILPEERPGRVRAVEDISVQVLRAVLKERNGKAPEPADSDEDKKS